MKLYKITVTGAVLDTVNATRTVTVDDQVLTFGREPVYVRAAELPPVLTEDPHLRIDEVQSAPPATAVTKLKAERVQEPEADLAVSTAKKRG
jgi:hypothetical protein